MDAQLEAAFGAFPGDPDADELSALLLVNRLLAADLDDEAVLGALDALERDCPRHADPWRFLHERGFRGNEADYGSLDNSRLDCVLDTRRGIPISLAVVLIHLARRLGRNAHGINFPGHFLVRVDDRLVDPFRMEETTEAECLSGRGDLAGQPREVLFAQAGPAAMLLRMLNNLKLAFFRDLSWHRALDVVDAQRALVPDEPGLYLERGDLWRRLGVISAAREGYQQALRLTEGSADQRHGELAEAARSRLDGLGGASDVVH
jgi:regulator of sirC expression with transglutaminase-like and TPR domain